MAVYEKKMDLTTRLIVKGFDLLERTLMKKRMFRMVINVVSKMHMFYITKAIDPELLERLG
ncbi:MAG: hypothetical protein ACTSPY_16740 [Candidatus Helarchaeota archaeon]